MRANAPHRSYKKAEIYSEFIGVGVVEVYMYYVLYIHKGWL
jgi:hypothetical protein